MQTKNNKKGQPQGAAPTHYSLLITSYPLIPPSPEVPRKSRVRQYKGG